MVRKISKRKTEELLQEVLLAAPETQFINGAGCIYFNPWTGAPRCAVGQVFNKAGIEFEDLDRPSDNRLKVNTPGLMWNKRFTISAIALLARAQQMQDDGMPWGMVHENLFGKEVEAQ